MTAVLTERLAEFLLTRLHEERHLALMADGEEWSYAEISTTSGGVVRSPEQEVAQVMWSPYTDYPRPVRVQPSASRANATGHHMARQSPAATVRRCDHLLWLVQAYRHDPVLLDRLAQPYAEHPEFPG